MLDDLLPTSLAGLLATVGLGASELLAICAVLAIIGGAVGRLQFKRFSHDHALRAAAAEAEALAANPRTFTAAEYADRALHTKPRMHSPTRPL